MLKTITVMSSGRNANGHTPRWGDGQPTEERDQPVPAPARGQPGRLVALVRRGLRRGPGPRRARPAVGGVLSVPLVSRDGARVVRGPADRRADEREPGRDQGRPGGTPGRGLGVHDRDPGPDRPGRLADDRVYDPRPGPLLLRDL